MFLQCPVNLSQQNPWHCRNYILLPGVVGVSCGCTFSKPRLLWNTHAPVDRAMPEVECCSKALKRLFSLFRSGAADWPIGSKFTTWSGRSGFQHQLLHEPNHLALSQHTSNLMLWDWDLLCCYFYCYWCHKSIINYTYFLLLHSGFLSHYRSITVQT